MDLQKDMVVMLLSMLEGEFKLILKDLFILFLLFIDSYYKNCISTE